MGIMFRGGRHFAFCSRKAVSGVDMAVCPFDGFCGIFVL